MLKTKVVSANGNEGIYLKKLLHADISQKDKHRLYAHVYICPHHRHMTLYFFLK